jgi:hypothetical protein
LKDYLRVFEAVRDLLSNRNQVLYNFQNASKSAESKKEKANNKPNDTKLQKEYEEVSKRTHIFILFLFSLSLSLFAYI